MVIVEREENQKYLATTKLKLFLDQIAEAGFLTTLLCEQHGIKGLDSMVEQ
jgi:hypothetical protein